MCNWQTVVPGAGRGPSADDETAGSADAFTAIMLEGDGVFAAHDQAFVDDVQHFEERHLGADVLGIVADHPALIGSILLPPDVKSEIHITCSSSGWDGRIGNRAALC